jgi:hypothetical protein
MEATKATKNHTPMAWSKSHRVHGVQHYEIWIPHGATKKAEIHQMHHPLWGSLAMVHLTKHPALFREQKHGA